MRIYQQVSSLFPRKVRKRFHELMVYSDVRINPDHFIGFQFVSILLLSIALGFFISFLFSVPFWIPFLIAFVGGEAIVYTLLTLSADARAGFVDTILPDVLQLMASNLRAGLTIDRALFISARPEFGLFRKELDHIAREVALGKPFDIALQEVTKRIRSDHLEKSVYLIASAARAGGELAPILEETAHDLRNREIAEKKIRASIGMYFIFIFIALGLALPFLLALSSVVVQVLISTFSSISMPSGVSTPLSLKATTLTVEFVVRYSMIFFTTNALLGSLMLGLIRKGKAKEGLKYLPMLLILCFAIFFIMRFLLGSTLGAVFAAA